MAAVLAVPVDTEGAVRTWLRTQADVSALVGTRVFFGVPQGATFPLVTLQRVGGSALLQDGGGWIDYPLIQIDCWGSSPADKAGATAVALAVQKAALRLRDGTSMAAGAAGMAAQVESVLFAPDPESGRARVIVDVSFGIRAA